MPKNYSQGGEQFDPRMQIMNALMTQGLPQNRSLPQYRSPSQFGDQGPYGAPQMWQTGSAPRPVAQRPQFPVPGGVPPRPGLSASQMPQFQAPPEGLQGGRVPPRPGMAPGPVNTPQYQPQPRPAPQGMRPGMQGGVQPRPDMSPQGNSRVSPLLQMGSMGRR